MYLVLTPLKTPSNTAADFSCNACVLSTMLQQPSDMIGAPRATGLPSTHLCMRAWNSFILPSMRSFAAAGFAWHLCRL